VSRKVGGLFVLTLKNGSRKKKRGSRQTHKWGGYLSQGGNTKTPQKENPAPLKIPRDAETEELSGDYHPQGKSEKSLSSGQKKTTDARGDTVHANQAWNGGKNKGPVKVFYKGKVQFNNRGDSTWAKTNTFVTGLW